VRGMMEAGEGHAVPFPRALILYPHVRQSTLSDFWQCHLMAYFKQEHENGWHSQPQARGSFFHAWAAKLLRTLEIAGQDKLRDEPECDNPRCQARPNEYLDEGDREYGEGEVCPVCSDGVLLGRALEDEAVALLHEVLRQADVPDEDRLPLPYGEHYHDLLWIVRKFAREQTFNMDRFVEAEHRYAAPIYYENPLTDASRPVERIFSGQMDAVFLAPVRDDHVGDPRSGVYQHGGLLSAARLRVPADDGARAHQPRDAQRGVRALQRGRVGRGQSPHGDDQP
jgi:hypothetical protein